MRPFHLFFLFLLFAFSSTGDAATKAAVRSALHRLKSDAAALADPASLPDFRRRFVKPRAALDFSMAGAAASGLRRFDVRGVKVGVDGAVEIKAAFPMIALSAEFQINGTFHGLPINGSGSTDVNLMDVVALTTGVVTDDSTTLTTTMTHSSSQLLLAWFPGHHRAIHKVLQKISERVFERYRPNLENVFNEAVEEELRRGGDESQEERDGPAEVPAGFALFQSGNANGFLDNMLTNARPTLAKHDPLDLPEAGFEFKKSIFGIPIVAAVKIYDGYLRGIQTLHRTGDAQMSQPVPTNMKISAHLGLAKMEGHYRMRTHVMNIGPAVEVSLHVAGVSVEMHVTVDFSKGKPETTLDNFKIDHIGKVDVDFHGLGPLDWIINPAGSLVANLVKDHLAKLIEGPLKNIIADKLKSGVIPIG